MQEGLSNAEELIIVEAVASSQLELVPSRVDLDQLELLLKVSRQSYSVACRTLLVLHYSQMPEKGLSISNEQKGALILNVSHAN